MSQGLGIAPLVIAGINAAVSLASAIIPALSQGCGQTCIAATQIVNDIEPTFEANVKAFQDGLISKSEGLANFDTLWNAVQQACRGIPGVAGANCVGDRQRGGKVDWFGYYRDPIEHGTETYTVSATNILGSNLQLDSNMVLVGLVAVVGLFLASKES